MGKRRRGRIPIGSFTLPDQIEVLSPEWLAALTVYWRALEGGQARSILEATQAAMYERTAEHAAWRLQQALRQLGLLDVQIIKLILSRFRTFVRLNAEYPAQQVAAEVLATLLAIEAGDRVRGDRVRGDQTRGARASGDRSRQRIVQRTAVVPLP